MPFWSPGSERLATFSRFRYSRLPTRVLSDKRCIDKKVDSPGPSPHPRRPLGRCYRCRSRSPYCPGNFPVRQNGTHLVQSLETVLAFTPLEHGSLRNVEKLHFYKLFFKVQRSITVSLYIHYGPFDCCKVT